MPQSKAQARYNKSDKNKACQDKYRQQNRELINERCRERDQRPDVKQYNTERGRARRLKHRQIFEERLGGQCVKCGTTENLEFDHIHPGDKSFNITSRMNCRITDEMYDELDKCQLLCKSCHKQVTIKQKAVAWSLLCQLSHGRIGCTDE